jgi:hypothetical protein
MALTSIYGQLLMALQNRITTAVPDVKWVDQDLGQLDIEGERPAVLFPCVLIDFSSSQYSDLLNNVQRADSCTVQLRLGFAPYSPSQAGAPESVREQSLGYYEVEKRVYQALQGWAPESGICDVLTRTTDGSELREDTLRVRRMLFTTTFDDHSANELKDILTPTLDIGFPDV